MAWYDFYKDPWFLSLSSAAAAAYASKQNSNSVEDATEKNLEQTILENMQREDLFHQARGSQGHAVLPEYFGDQEQVLGQSVTDYYNRIMNEGSAEERQAMYDQMLQRYRPLQDQAVGTVEDVYSGATLDKRMGNLEPVLEARLNQAATQGTAYETAMEQTQAAIAQQAANRGFMNGGTTQNRLLLGNNVANAQRIADLTSTAKLQNELDRYGVNDADVQMRLDSLGLPGQMAQQGLAIENLPVQNEANRMATAMAPYNFFKLPYDTYEPYRTPEATPVQSTGSIIASGLSQFLNQANSSNQQQAFIDQLTKIYGDSAQGQGTEADKAAGQASGTNEPGFWEKFFESLGSLSIGGAVGASSPAPATPTTTDAAGTTTPSAAVTNPTPNVVGFNPVTNATQQWNPAWDSRDLSNVPRTFNVGWPVNTINNGFGMNLNWGNDNPFSINIGGLTGQTGTPRFIEALP